MQPILSKTLSMQGWVAGCTFIFKASIVVAGKAPGAAAAGQGKSCGAVARAGARILDEMAWCGMYVCVCVQVMVPKYWMR